MCCYDLQKAKKNYCFELSDIPVEAEYLEVRYSVSALSPSLTLSYVYAYHCTITHHV